jgi:Flp pilus assembly protein TadG
MRVLSLIRRFARDEGGMSAVEFALLAPILIAFYMGMAEFCQGYMAQKRMGHATAMVADLVALEDAVSQENLSDIMDIGGLIMKPFSDSTLHIRVSSVTFDDGVARVDWVYGDPIPGKDLAKDDILPTSTNCQQSLTSCLPSDLLEDGQSVVMSEAIYDYESPADYLMPGVTKFTHTYYLRPRTTNMTACSDC